MAVSIQLSSAYPVADYSIHFNILVLGLTFPGKTSNYRFYDFVWTGLSGVMLTLLHLDMTEAYFRVKLK